MHDDCECCSKGMAEFEREEQRKMDKYGYVVHYIPDSDSFYHFDMHTHGLLENYCHLEFQLVLNIPQGIAHNLICTLADRVKAGEKFKANDRVKNVVKNFEVLLIERTVDNEQVLRLVLPDRAGNVDDDKIDSGLVMQFFA